MNSATIGALLAEGDSLADKHDTAGALARYDQVLAVDSENRLALAGKTWLLLTAGQIDQALECQDRLVALDPGDPTQLSTKAQLLTFAGRYREAIHSLEHVLRLDPSDGTALQLLGDAYRAIDRGDKALDAYDRAITVAGDRADLWIAKGDALIDAGRPGDAIAAFERAFHLEPEWFSEIDWNIRGDLYFIAQDYETAARFYRKGVEIEPNVDGWRGLGQAYQETDRLTEAEQSYAEGLKLQPDDVQLLNDQGVVLLDMDRTSEALAFFEQVVKLDADSLEGWLNIGFVHQGWRNFEIARDAYLQATRIEPDRAETWVDLGMCETEVGDDRDFALRSALSRYERAIALDEEYLWAWNNAGWVLGELGEHEAALARLNRAIELDQTEHTPWGNKVALLLGRGEIDEAEACAEQMLGVVADQAAALCTKSSILTDWRGKDHEALELLQGAIELYPDDVGILANLAETLLKVGQYATSRKYARRVLEKQGMPADDRCASLFVIYASYAMEGKTSARRRDAFREFIDYFRTQYVLKSAGPFVWNYRGLERAIRESAATEESTFLLSMAIDVQAGRFDAKVTSFFSGED